MAKPSGAVTSTFEAGRAGLSAPFCVNDLRGFLQGDWRIERRVFDRRLDLEGRFSGRVTFAPAGEGLLAREQGKMTYGESETDAERTLRYDFESSPDGETARVYFPDGRFFHDLDLRAGHARVYHLCGEDHYRGHFRVIAIDGMTQRWRVQGPRKDLVLVTRMSRPA